MPFTIYLAQNPSYNILAFLRFLAVLILVFSLARRSAVKWYVFFFFCGLFIYQFLQSEKSFFRREQAVLLVLYTLGLSLVWYREAFIAFLRKKLFFSQLHKRRWEKKYNKQAMFLSRSFEALGYSPQDPKQMDRREQKSYETRGSYVIFGFFFSALHEALWDFQKKPAISFSLKSAFEEFQREWEIFLNHLRQKLFALDLKLAIGADHLLAGDLLHNPQREEILAKIKLDSKQRKRIFQILFAAYELLDFSTRTRRAIEQRGHSGWYLNILVAAGEALHMKNSSTNPAFVFRGPLIKDLHQAFQYIEEREPDKNSSLRSDRIWIESRLEKLYESRFEMSTALSCRNWKSPEFLLSEYTKDRSSLKPNQNFWASLDGPELFLSA